MNSTKTILGVIALCIIFSIESDALGQEGGRTFGVSGDSVYLVDYENQQTLYLFDAGVSPGYPQTFGGASDSNRLDSFYAIQNPLTDWTPQGNGDVLGESNLYRINPYTQGVTHIGGTGSLPDGDPIGMREIAYNWETGELWGVNYNSKDDTEADGFYSINPVTGNSMLIGQHGLNNVFGLAYDPITLQIVGTSHVDVSPEAGDADFVRFNTATGLPTGGTPVPTGNTRITDLWFSEGDPGQMRGIGNGPNRLLDVDTATGQAWTTAGGGDPWEEGVITHNIIGLGGQAYTAPFGMFVEGEINTMAAAGLDDDEDMWEEGGSFNQWGGGSEASAYVETGEESYSYRETTMMAEVEVQSPWDAGWSQMNFSAEYYSEGEPPEEGWAEGAFSFEIDSESPGAIYPGNLPTAGSSAVFGIGGPMILSVAATEDVEDYHEFDEGSQSWIPVATWDTLDWMIEVSDGTETYILSRDGEHTAALEIEQWDTVEFSMHFAGDTTSTTDGLNEPEGEEDWPALRANLVLDFVLLDPSEVNPLPIDFFGPGSEPFDPIIPPDAVNPDDPWVFDPVTIGDGSPGTGTDPIFFDPEIAVGYRFKTEDGDPTMVGVILPDLGDDGYDLYVVDENGDLVLLMPDVEPDVQHTLPGVTEFVVLGIDEGLMLDPNNTLAFVTGLIFDGQGTVHLSMMPITTEVVPEPASVLLAAIGLLFIVAIRKKQIIRC